jgi:hypothetical protein
MPRPTYHYQYDHDYWITRAAQSHQRLRRKWGFCMTAVVAAIALLSHWGNQSPQQTPQQQKTPKLIQKY